MVFNSLEFLLFFPIVTAAYFAARMRGRQWVLVAASSLFYMAFVPAYVLVLYGAIGVDYVAARLIEKSEGSRRTTWLVMSLAANLGALAFFKYGGFAAHNVNALLSLAGMRPSVPTIEVLLPIGLSFHTFQGMSYVIEVYKRRYPAERSLLVYALYVMFYPQLVAGPIERPQTLLAQLKEEHPFDAARATRGLRRMLWGFFKKIVVADRLALIVNAVYAAPAGYDGAVLAIATAAFAIQIYADFSGYSDIAIGAADVMGIRLSENFRQPYTAQSVRELWSRWHVTLMSWLRDYLYIPLGGNRVRPARRSFNVLVTFLASGLWHGASFTYVVWGGLNGVFVLIEARLWPKGLPRSASLFRGVARTLVTFALVCVTWVFFRAPTLRDAGVVFTRLPTAFAALARPSAVLAAIARLAIDGKRLALTAAAVALLLTLDTIAARRGTEPSALFGDLPRLPRWVVYWGLAGAILLLGAFARQQFLYFQF